MQVREEGNATQKRMRAYRQKLRESGMRPVQIWVPDVRKTSLKEEAARQSRLAASARGEDDSLAFIEDAADYGLPS